MSEIRKPTARTPRLLGNPVGVPRSMGAWGCGGMEGWGARAVFGRRGDSRLTTYGVRTRQIKWAGAGFGVRIVTFLVHGRGYEAGGNYAGIGCAPTM